MKLWKLTFTTQGMFLRVPLIEGSEDSYSRELFKTYYCLDAKFQ